MLLIVNTKGIDVKVKKGFDNLSDGKGVVWWNPNTASEVNTNTGENATLSPATLLEHEFDHSRAKQNDPEGHKERWRQVIQIIIIWKKKW